MYFQGVDNDQNPWFSVTLIVNESRNFKCILIIYWSETEFGSTARLKDFEYKYLNKEPNDKALFLKMIEYEINHAL